MTDYFEEKLAFARHGFYPVGMYIRKTTTKHKGRSYTNYLLVDAVRTDKGPRQKVICSLGNLKPRPAAAWLRLAHQVEQALAGQADLFDPEDGEVQRLVQRIKAVTAEAQGETAGAETTAAPEKAVAAPVVTAAVREGLENRDEVVAIRINEVQTEAHREAGPVWVGWEFWQRLGLSGILAGVGMSEEEQWLSAAMTLNRLICPLSEKAMVGWLGRAAIADLVGVEVEKIRDDHLYRNPDKLHGHRGAIESALVERERSLFNLEPKIYIYDLTSTYFEGEMAGNEKAVRGYSRDHRPDCKQVVIGLAIGREGFPLAHEVFKGNVKDHQTVGKMLDLLGERVGLVEGDTVVIDRGMAYQDNFAELRSRKLHYIVAARQAERNAWLDEFEDLSGFVEIERPKGVSSVRVRKQVKDGEAYILCLSAGRKLKDRAIREKQEERFLAEVKKLQERIAAGKLKKEVKIGEAIGRMRERYPRVGRYYPLTYDSQLKRIDAGRDQAKYELATELDGAYILRTDRTDLNAEEVWRLSITLTRAEAAFRAMKSPLGERPIYHRLEPRVETHIFLCVLAYHLLVAIETTLQQHGEHSSWATVREVLSTHQLCTIVLPAENGDVLNLRRLSKPEPEVETLYRLLGVKPETVKSVRTWVRAGG